MSIEQAERQEFLNAVRNVEKYHEQLLKQVTPKRVVPKRAPAPDRWLTVVIKKDCKEPPYGMLELELPNKRTVLCSPKAVVQSPGNHARCLPTGTIGTARVELVDDKYRVTEARFEGNPPNEKEIGEVVIWRDEKNQGWVKRPCGDWLFVVAERQRDVIAPGNWLRFSIKRSKSQKYPGHYVGMYARNIEAPKGPRRISKCIEDQTIQL